MSCWFPGTWDSPNSQQSSVRATQSLQNISCCNAAVCSTAGTAECKSSKSVLLCGGYRVLHRCCTSLLLLYKDHFHAIAGRAAVWVAAPPLGAIKRFSCTKTTIVYEPELCGIQPGWPLTSCYQLQMKHVVNLISGTSEQDLFLKLLFFLTSLVFFIGHCHYLML